MARAYIGVGSNLGDRRHNIERGLTLLEDVGSITRRSNIHQTEPFGVPEPESQRAYLNAAVELMTLLTPRDLLDSLLAVERRLGRRRGTRNAARTLDLDLLFYSDLVLDDPGLCVPHPRLVERRFVLAPLHEIAPGLLHPKLGKTVSELLAELDASSGR